MIKAAALKPVTTGDMNIVNNVLTNGHQNIKIEYSEEENLVPHVVESLACQMVDLDDYIKDYLRELRSLYGSKKDTFHLSMNHIPLEKKAEIIKLFENLQGVFSSVYYCENCDVLYGKLTYSPKAQKFIDGKYMEIACRKMVKDILCEFENKYQKNFNLYSNTIVKTANGAIQQEFDLIIESPSDGYIYLIEIKSGNNFNEFDKFYNIGCKYHVIPKRLMMINNYLSNEQIESIEYFCEYYCVNLKNDSLRKKIFTMLENDL